MSILTRYINSFCYECIFMLYNIYLSRWFRYPYFVLSRVASAIMGYAALESRVQ